MTTDKEIGRSGAREAAQRIAGSLRPWLILALVCGGFSLSPSFLRTFWTADYLPNILQQAATNMILAVGMTFVILTGGIDLSVGSVLALCGIALGLAVKGGMPDFLQALVVLPIAILAGVGARRGAQQLNWNRGVPDAIGMLIGLLVLAAGVFVLGPSLSRGGPLVCGLLAAAAVGISCGLINGLVVSLGRVPSFVATLGMLVAARGLTVYATDGNSVSGLPPALGSLGQGWALVLIAGAVVLAGAVLQSRSRAGRYIQAIGSSEEASRLSGVDVAWYKTLSYVLSGLGAAIAAIALTAKFQLADTGAGTGAELNAIAAVVIGGTSLNGGSGSVVGSLVGALTIAVLNSGLVLVGVKDTLQGVVIGAVIVAAVMVDGFRRNRSF